MCGVAGLGKARFGKVRHGRGQMVKEHSYTITIRERTDEALEKEDDEDYLRHTLLSKILKCFVEAEFDTKIKYISSAEVEHPKSRRTKSETNRRNMRRTTMRKLLMTTAAACLLSVPALAWVDHPSREHHDIWKMKCYPDDGPAFNVTTNDSVGGLVILYGKNGQARSNTIKSVENTDYGFLVIANGRDAKGRHREIELHVTKNGDRSHLAVDRDTV